jgi:single-stranded-DNA-specific exonuclease
LPAVSKVWHLLSQDAATVERMTRELRIPTTIAQLLINRGISTPAEGRRFIDAPLNGLHLPQALPGVPEAVDRIYDAVQKKTRICIYGDYDVDGTTGTSILYGLLQRLGANVEFYIPLRLEEGYGVNLNAIRELAASGVKVLITVDCGISSLIEADEAKSLGIDFIVTDHHEMKDRLPDAVVCVHPRLPGTAYPFGGLSGAGVAYKLAWALAVRHCGSDKVTENLRNYLLDALCLATLGLIADIVPLLDENRILVRAGLNRINKLPPLGVKSLIDTCQLNEGAAVRSEEVGFRIGPRINAAGRLGCARLVVEMFTTSNAVRAKEIAEFLDRQNSERQFIERKITAQAIEMLDATDLSGVSAVVLMGPDWHPGVIGIVSSRVMEHTGKPAIVFSMKEGSDLATGSGRSINGFPLNEALQACDDLLEGHGGHAKAAGAKIHPKNLDAFRERFNALAAERFAGGPPPKPRLNIDAEVPLNALTTGFVKDLRILEPYGEDNRRPLFLAGGLQVVGDPKTMGKDGIHMQFRVKQTGTSLRAVAFGKADRMDELMSQQGNVCLAFVPKINEWNGYTNVELEVVDFQPGSVAEWE